MIDYIKGKIEECEPTRAIIDCSGVGYEVFITLPDYGNLRNVVQSETDIKLFVHEVIRDDARILYGFITKQSRELFRLLIGVSGVGPGSARLILSAVSAQDLRESVECGDHTILKTVKGIGTKTAQRIVVDLNGKMSAESGFATSDVVTKLSVSKDSEVAEEAVAALQILGYTADASRKTVRILLKQDPSLSVESLIRSALRSL